jgi:hypothetical protein
MKVTVEDVRFRQQWDWQTNSLLLIAIARPGTEKGRPSCAVGVRVERERAEDFITEHGKDGWRAEKMRLKNALRNNLVCYPNGWLKREGEAVIVLSYHLLIDPFAEVA